MEVRFNSQSSILKILSFILYNLSSKSKTMDHKLLEVKINYVTIYQAVETIESWLKKKNKHYVVTPNPEIIVDADFDRSFREALNGSDLAIPDSPRLGWGSYIKAIKNPFLRLIYSPSFLLPHLLPRFNYPVTSGIDLMEELLSLSQEKGFTTAYLGGSKKVADKLLKCLQLKYPKLKIVFCAGNMMVNKDGDIYFDTKSNKMTGSKNIISVNVPKNTKVENKFNYHLLTKKIDIMFIAFGHKKQEKWMHKNINKLNTKVMIGVGGSFDYISGEVPRAPLYLRQLGLEWLFRVINQPWRIKRLWKLLYFIYLILVKK